MVQANGFPPGGFSSATLSLEDAGRIRFRFTDARSGQVEFDIDGISYSKSIVRTEF